MDNFALCASCANAHNISAHSEQFPDLQRFHRLALAPHLLFTTTEAILIRSGTCANTVKDLFTIRTHARISLVTGAS